MSNKLDKPQTLGDNVVAIDIHKNESEAPAPGSFAVGQIEDDFSATLTPVTVAKEQKSLFKHKPYRKLKRAASPPKVSYISAKKLQAKKASWKKRMFKIAVVLVLGVVSGSILGGWYKNYTDSMFSSDVYPADVTPYLDDTNAMMTHILGSDNDADKQNFDNILKARGKSPLDYSASENYALATYKASLANSFYLESKGGVTTMGITQSVYSIRAYDGNTYQLSSQSKGMLTLAICAVYNKNGNNVKLIQGNNITDTTADWTGAVTNYTADEFKQENGSLPNVLSPYIVSSKTIKNENDIKIEQTLLNESNVYSFEMELDAIPAAAYYYKQVKLTSGLADYPIFNKIKIKVFIDENWNFVQTQIEESYTVKYGIAAACLGTLTIDYTFNEQVDLPYKG